MWEENNYQDQPNLQIQTNSSYFQQNIAITLSNKSPIQVKWFQDNNSFFWLEENINLKCLFVDVEIFVKEAREIQKTFK